MIKNELLSLFEGTRRDNRNEISRERFEKYLSDNLRMGKLDKVSRGISATKYYILVSPTSIKYLLNKGVARGFDAFFNVNNSRLYQDGKYVCLEVPNKYPTTLTFFGSAEALQRLPANDSLTICYGENLDGDPLLVSLTECVHLLVAGQTGSGKSVFLHNAIMSLLLQYRKEELNLVLIDPKQVEFGFYRGLSMVREVISSAERANRKIRDICDEMDSRYELFERFGVRDISTFNATSEYRLPRIVVVIEEFADLVAQSDDVVSNVQRLVAKARACGIHVILATQRPEAAFMTGKLRSNFKGRVAFSVADTFNSRIILGRSGAEKLTGAGDGIAQLNSGVGVRFQSALITESEILRVVTELKRQELPLS